MGFLPLGPIDYAEHVIQGSQDVMPGETINIVFWCLTGHELTTQGHESSALTTRTRP